MRTEAVQRHLRQIALPEIGPAGQQRLATAVMAVAGQNHGGDVTAEVAARYLAAAGVGTLRLIGRLAADRSGLEASLRQSNPDLILQHADWPADGAAWMTALGGVELVLRAGFDDDAMLPAAVRLAIPALVARGRDNRVDLVSFRRQGPCPHAPLDIPRRAAETAAPPGPGAVVAGTLAAAEAIHALLGLLPAGGAAARARHLAIPLDGGEPRAQEIPWAPECFACGGSGTEMSFS
jgi:hypothetical protein